MNHSVITLVCCALPTPYSNLINQETISQLRYITIGHPQLTSSHPMSFESDKADDAQDPDQGTSIEAPVLLLLRLASPLQLVSFTDYTRVLRLAFSYCQP